MVFPTFDPGTMTKAELESYTYFPKEESQRKNLNRTIEHIRSLRNRKLHEQIDDLRAKLAEAHAKCADFDATLVLLRRAELEQSDKRIRLLRVLRNPITGELLRTAHRRGRLTTGKDLSELDALRVAMELCELGHMQYQTEVFVLTPTGKALAEKLDLT